MSTGIYIHIPFCNKACSYCDFHFSTSKKNIDLFLKCLLIEIGLTKINSKKNIKTIYFGGGTPSVLKIHQIEKILTYIKKKFSTSECLEITLEANPNNINLSYIKELKKIGINRISLGVQSFDEKILTKLGRTHSAKEALKSIELIKNHFTNYSIDLIFGIKGQSINSFENDLYILKKMLPNHFSAYILSIEKKTLMGYLENSKKIKQTADEKQIYLMYNKVLEFSNENGYDHYELSNYARKGKKSIHNQIYWNMEPYIGFGPSAHSFSLKKRRWNISNNNLYIKKILSKQKYFYEENIDEEKRFLELLLTKLRTKNGLKVSEISYYKNYDFFLDNIAKLKKEKLVYFDNKTLRILEDKWIFMDYILSKLI